MLREIETLWNIREARQLPLHGHEYAGNDPPTLTSYLVYADNIDFICEKDENPKTIVEKI